MIAFGLPSYKDHPACFSVQSLPQLVRALDVIERDDLGAQFSEAALVKYLLWVENNSIVADMQEGDMTEARLKNFTELYRELLGASEIDAGPDVCASSEPSEVP